MAVQIQGFSLKTLNQKVKQSKNAEIDSATITVKFSSPKGFEHEYTLEDVSSLDELKEEVETTEDIARERLRDNWLPDSDDGERAWQEVKETLIIEEPDDVTSFRELKDLQDSLIEARDKTEEVYGRTGRGRSQKIQNALEGSENLEKYKENLDKVDKTVDFEENIDLGEDDSAFETGRQRTTGDIEWVNQNGDAVRTLIYPNRVIYQVGGPDGRQVEFDDKDSAEEYFKNNRIA